MTTSFDSLPNKKKIEFWQTVEEKISAVLLTCVSHIAESVVNEVREYLGHNEFGLAWESLCDGIIQSGVKPEKKTQLLMLEIGSVMGCNQQDSFHHNTWKQVVAFFG